MTVEAMLWLQELDVAARVNMWLQDKLLKSSFSGFCRDFRFFQIHGLSEPTTVYVTVYGTAVIQPL